MHPANCVAFIQFSFFDSRTHELVTLSGLGHVTPAEHDSTWRQVDSFEGSSCFQATRLDSHRNTIERRTISSETCEALLRQPIATLIARGRARLASKNGRTARQIV